MSYLLNENNKPCQKKLKCNVCLITHHMKCVSIVPDVLSQLEKDKDIWYCCQCLVDNLQYIGIEDEMEFISAINEIAYSSVLICLSDILFMPFELNDSYHQYGNENIDPDFQHFNSLTQYITQCIYFAETGFINEMTNCTMKKQKIFMCHLNVQSMRKNLDSSVDYMDLLKYNFNIICFTETWLMDDDCDVYMIPGYRMVEKLRADRIGGGVAICIKDDIDFT